MFGWGFERMKEEIFLGKRMEERIFDDSMMTIFVKVKKEIWTCLRVRRRKSYESIDIYAWGRGNC